MACTCFKCQASNFNFDSDFDSDCYNLSSLNSNFDFAMKNCHLKHYNLFNFLPVRFSIFDVEVLNFVYMDFRHLHYAGCEY